MKKIYLITHAEASHSVENKVGGWYDSHLTKLGVEKAKTLTEKIESFGAKIGDLAVYSSDLLRCKQTTEIIMAENVSNIIFDARLREMCFGNNEGIDQKEHEKVMQPTCSTSNRLDHRICSGAESRRELAERIKSFVDEIMNEKGDVLIVTHGFAATFVVATFQKLEISNMGYISYRFTPGSVSILVEDDVFQNRTLKLLNG
ncbi:MAG: histidine phosphatase family protein [Planctomycetota bacterium]|nr:MAG: histidine phosphatase family protein [Planctomycetota bacterium]